MDVASQEDWPVRRLAQVSGVSEAHFARAFRQAFGVPPHRYLLSRRVERAIALLRETELSVTEIAFATGWSSLGTFGRTFRDVTGRNPSDLRDNLRHGQGEQVGVPQCYLRASRPAPDLKIAVSEKRRREGGCYEGPRNKQEVSMSQGVQVAGIYVRDQDEALEFYVEKLGFRVHTDARNGDYRWLTVQHPGQADFQLGLFAPQEPVVDAATCPRRCRERSPRARCRRSSSWSRIVGRPTRPMRGRGVEFTQEPTERYGAVDASFRDPSGNGWKLVER